MRNKLAVGFTAISALTGLVSLADQPKDAGESLIGAASEPAVWGISINQSVPVSESGGMPCSCPSHAGREGKDFPPAATMRIKDLPTELPGEFSIKLPYEDHQFTLHLEKNRVFGENTRFMVSDGTGSLNEVDLGRDGSYLGRVEEHPDFIVSAILSEQGLIASITRPGRESIMVTPVYNRFDRSLHEVSIGDSGDHEVSRQAGAEQVADDVGVRPDGNTDEMAASNGPIATAFSMIGLIGNSGVSTATLPPTRVMDVLEFEVGVEIGSRAFIDNYGSNLASAQSAAASIANNMDARYLRGAGIKHVVGTVIIRTDAGTDPLRSITSNGSTGLSDFRNYWNANPGEVGTTHDLAVYHVRSAPSGRAYVNSVGSSNRYALSCSNGPTSWADGTLVHEFGHSWNLRHTGDAPISEYNYGGGGAPPSSFYESKPRNNSGMNSAGGSHTFVSVMHGGGNHNIGRLSSDEANTVYGIREGKRGFGNVIASPGQIPPFGRRDSANAGSAPVTIDVVANDYDANNDVLDAELLDTVSHQGGTIGLSAGTGPGGRNELIYTPPSGFTGTDFFHYTVCDTTDRTDWGAVYVSVAGPVVIDTTQTTFNHDFGSESSPVQGGWTAITPGTFGDISWSGSLGSVDRGANPGVNSINRDFVTSSQVRTLSHKIGNGLWNVTINMGDYSQARDLMKVTAEGGAVVESNVNSDASQFVYVTFQVAVSDGQLDIEFSDEGGSSAEWALTRMSLARTTPTEDTDGDGLPDFYEDQYYGHPTDNTDGTGDLDSDGLTDAYETQTYGHPTDSADAMSDFDDDGLTDVAEIDIHGTEPLIADTDLDGFDDGLEVDHGDPLDALIVPALSVASTSLAGYWPFDETSGGTAGDFSGNDQDATWFGDGGANVWVSGLIGGASQANDENGGNDEEHYRIANLSGINGASALSISLWFNQNVDSNNNSTYNGLFMTRSLLSSFGGGDENWGFALESNGTPRKIDWRIDQASGAETSNISGNVVDEWHHVLFVWNGVTGIRSLYQDGVLLASQSAPTGSITNGGEWRIGDDSCCGSREFTGTLDDLSVYSSALDADDAALLHDAGYKQVSADFLLPGLNTDGDLLDDTWERRFFGDLGSSSGAPGEDFDNDGEDDVDEQALGTNPTDADTDGDGYPDGVEVDWETSPTDETSIPIIPGLVAYYPFDEGSGGTAYDAATNDGSQNAIAEKGSAGWSAGGRIGGALDLSGSDSLLAASAIPSESTAFTISAWVKPDGIGGYKGIYSGRDNPGNWGLNLNTGASSSGHADFRFANSGGSSFGVTSGNNSVAPGEWYHLAITWEADDVSSSSTAYLNGVAVAAPSAGARIDFTNPTNGFYIGDDPCCGGREFDGQIDDLAVFAAALSPDHIEMIYNAGVSGQSMLTTIEPELELLVTSITGNPVNGDVTIEWDSTGSALSYSVLSTTDLSLPIESWTIIAPSVLNAGATSFYTHAGASNSDSSRFYIIREN